MVRRPLVFCPVDFSDASRGALRYAATLAEHFQASLTVLTVDDPLLADAVRATRGEGWQSAQSHQQLETFVKDTFRHRQPQLPELRLTLATGKPAPEILRAASDRHADLIVMSSHGASGFRKLMFGSTTERVLRETRIPTLITPATDTGPDNLEDVKTAIRTVLVPVDLTAVTGTQVRIARGLAEALDASIVLAHIMEPVVARPEQESLVPRLNRERRRVRSATLSRLKDSLPPRLRSEIVFGYGDPAEEIARIARERGAGAVVMGLHSADHSGPRMGSVTYRVLCQVPSLIVALPPGVEKMVSRQLEVAHAGAAV